MLTFDERFHKIIKLKNDKVQNNPQSYVQCRYLQLVGGVLEPPPVVEPPHVAMMFGAWQRRAVLVAATAPDTVSKLLRYGFFADTDVTEPKLLAKTLDQYELRPEKD